MYQYQLARLLQARLIHGSGFDGIGFTGTKMRISARWLLSCLQKLGAKSLMLSRFTETCMRRTMTCSFSIGQSFVQKVMSMSSTVLILFPNTLDLASHKKRPGHTEHTQTKLGSDLGIGIPVSASYSKLPGPQVFSLHLGPWGGLGQLTSSESAFE